jgi:hypothetical protein
MKRSQQKKTVEEPQAEDLSFPPPYTEHAKYLLLADKFLSTNGHRNVVSIDGSKHFRYPKRRERAA